MTWRTWHGRVMAGLALLAIVGSAGVMVAKDRQNAVVHFECWLTSNDDEGLARQPLTWRSAVRVMKVGAQRCWWRVHPPKPKQAQKETAMAWTVSGAGDNSFNGTYVESGTYNGQPAYVLNPGGPDERWLYFALSSDWRLDANLGAETTADYVGGATLPGTWFVNEGTPPAPTLAAWVPTPPDWPFTFYWDGAAPYYGPGDRMRPVRAIIGGTAYVVFPFYNSGAPGSWGFTFYNEATHEFTTKSLTGPLWTDSHDPGQTMCCYDAGDGASLYLCSGSYLDPDPPYPPSFLFALWDVSATPPTLTDSEVVATLPSIHITPFLQVADDTFRFVCVDGTDVKYYEYVALSGTLTLLGTTTLPALPGGYAQVTGDVYEAGTVTCLDRVDTVLFERDGTVYWMRHCKDGSSPPQHRIVAYALTV